VIVVPNDRLLDAVGKLPVRQAFKVSDEVLMRSVKGITELITKPGLVNLDFADVRTVMEKGGVAMIGLGESDSESKAQDSVKSALRSPLLDVDISGANSALVNVTGGADMSIEEAEGVVEEIYERIDPDARIIWGTSVDDGLEGTMRTMIVVTGVQSPQIYGTNDVADPVRYRRRGHRLRRVKFCRCRPWWFGSLRGSDAPRHHRAARHRRLARHLGPAMSVAHIRRKRIRDRRRTPIHRFPSTMHLPTTAPPTIVQLASDRTVPERRLRPYGSLDRCRAGTTAVSSTDD